MAFNKTNDWPFHPTEMFPETPDPATTEPVIFPLVFDEKLGFYTKVGEPKMGTEFSDDAKEVILNSIKEWNKSKEEFSKDSEDSE